MLARLVLIVFFALGFSSTGYARLQFSEASSETGDKWIIVRGEFEFTDDLRTFGNLVVQARPRAVVFVSHGGNVAKAMELGRLIRAADLITIQPRGLECESACALAFLGGSSRFAEAGAIGVHRSSFENTDGMTVNYAVAQIQRMTAEVIAYISSMGADPGLLQLALSYDSDDMRYLSSSEMAHYRVTTSGMPPTSVQPSASRTLATEPESKPAASSATVPAFSADRPMHAIVHHPKGRASVLSAPSADASDVAALKNGDSVDILALEAQWYRVRVVGKIGFMHSSWLAVDGFEGGRSEMRLIQTNSFDTYDAAEKFARSSGLKSDVWLAVNGWYAVTVNGALSLEAAKANLRTLKESGKAPRDAFVSYGNNYVRKLCCE